MKKVLLITIGFVFIGVAAFIFISRENATQLTEAELQEKFRCDRVTTEVLATDIYCQNPEFYYEDAKKGAVIGASDFDDPRYKARYEN